MKLASTSQGIGPSITFLHGFTQTKESWIPVINGLPKSYTFHIIDAPGHGSSPQVPRTLQESADDIAESMATGVLIGYSMGARMALHVALQHPQKVNALVLISGTAGIDSSEERRSRITSDEALAERISDIGVPAFIDEWLSNPMFDGLSKELADIPARCSNTAEGLGNSLRHAGTGTQQPMWTQLQDLRIPVLLISGGKDKKFTELAQRMHALMPHSEHIVMNHVGHTCHLEDIDAFTRHVQQWLLRL